MDHCCLQNMLARKRMKLRHPRDWLLLHPSTLRNIKLKERLTNHMHPKDKSESYLMNNCLSGTMSSGANLLSIFVPSYFLTVTYHRTCPSWNCPFSDSGCIKLFKWFLAHCASFIQCACSEPEDILA